MANNYATISQFFAMYDARTFSQLSNDANSSVLNPATLGFLLDISASELDSHLDGRVALPIPPTTVPAVGVCSIIAVPPNGSTVILADGVIGHSPVTFTFTSGGSGTNVIDTVTGNTSDIAAIWANAINLAGLNLQAQANGYAVAIINTTVPTTTPPSGYAGNIPIVSSSPAIAVQGMAGGTTRGPLVLTRIVGAKTAGRMFGRRNDIPAQVKGDLEEADKWLDLFDRGMVQIPSVNRATFPQLQDSFFTNGVSAFDWIFGTFPSNTGPTSVAGQAIPPNQGSPFLLP